MGRGRPNTGEGRDSGLLVGLLLSGPEREEDRVAPLNIEDIGGERLTLPLKAARGGSSRGLAAGNSDVIPKAKGLEVPKNSADLLIVGNAGVERMN
jgi:hypothetical protein